MKARVFVTACLVLCGGSVAFTAVEFSGYLTSGSESKFALTDVDDGKSSGWLVLGDSFKGHTILSFDPQKESLRVRTNDSTIELGLKSSRVKAGDASGTDIALQLKLAKDELAELRKKFTDAHPRVQEQLRKIAELEKSSELETARAKLAQAQERLAKLRAERAALEKNRAAEGSPPPAVPKAK